MSKIPQLTNLHIRITSSCNFNCQHCYAAEWFNEKYELSIDACGDSVAAATVVPGDNLIPEVGKYELKYSAKGTGVTAKNYLTVEAVKYFRLGGQSGMDMAKTLVVRAKMA